MSIPAFSGEYECYVDVEGERIPCSVSFDVEENGYKPLVYGIFDLDDDSDLTQRVDEEEFDRVYAELCQFVAERILN